MEQKKLDFLNEIAGDKEKTVSRIIRDAIDDYIESYIAEALNMDIGPDIRINTKISRPPREDYNK